MAGRRRADGKVPGRMPRLVAVAATVALTAGVMALTAAPAQAASLTVNSTADTATSGDGECTLREAIANANANADTTGGDCVAGSGTDTITFAPSVTGTITLGTQLPPITDAAGLTMTGPGAAALAISGGDAVRLLVVEAGAALTIGQLTLRDGFEPVGDGGAISNAGTLTIASSVVSGNTAALFGGAVLSVGNLTITDSSFTGNTAAIGGAVESNGTLTIEDSTFSANSASGSGGAIRASSTLVVTRSVFSGNFAATNGGAILLNSDSAPGSVITESTFVDNTAATDRGGAVSSAQRFGVLSVVRSTFTGNSAAFGGAVSAVGVLNVSMSTFEDNSADAGGALYSILQSVSHVRNSTFAGNTASEGGASLYLINSQATLTGSAVSAAEGQVNCVGTVVDGGANIDSGASCGFTAPSGAAWGSNVDPMLGALADNGGPTLTMLPQPGSPAIDAITPGELACPTDPPATGDLTTDQRGVTRPQGPKCDIGAVEVEPASVTYTVSPFERPVTNQPGTTRLKAGDTLPLKFSVTDDADIRVTDLTGADVVVSVLLTTCGSDTVVVDVESAAGATLRLRPDGSYQVDLKTPKSWAGLCGTVTVSTPNDGERTANVEFTGGGRGRG